MASPAGDPVVRFGDEPSIVIDEIGLPAVMTHFAPQDYRQQPTNWAVAQDDRGLIYVANNDGILEYDGETWRTIRVATNTVVRSLAVSDDGVVYVGAQGDFGYLSPDSSGVLHYVSLIDEVPEDYRTFKDVWATRAADDGIYFQTYRRLFRWDGEEIEVWEAEGLFHTSFSVRGQFYVREHNARGLLTVRDDSLKPLLDENVFEVRSIYTMAPYERGRILIGTRKGFFLYGAGGLTPFPTQVDEYVGEYMLYHGAALANGSYALATLRGGVVVIDETGRLIQVINEQAGLPDGVVNYVYPDAQGGLWMALNNQGIFRADMRAPVSVYDDRLGLSGYIHAITRHEGTLYVATGGGLYYLDRHRLNDELGSKRSRFVKMPDMGIPNDLHATSRGLYVATQSGVYLVENARHRRVVETAALVVQDSKVRARHVYLGLKSGFAVLEEVDGSWSVSKVCPEVSEEIRSIRELKDGTLWLGTAAEGALRVRLTNGNCSTAEVDRFGEQHGLPAGYVGVRTIGGRLAFITEAGVYRYVDGRGAEAGNSFVPDTALAAKGKLIAIDEDAGGDVWMAYASAVDLMRKQEDGSYVRERIEALDHPVDATWRVLYGGDDGVTWISNGSGLMRYNTTAPQTPAVMFPPLFRGVQVLRSGQVIYGGAGAGALLAGTGSKKVAHELNYGSNDIRLAFAAPLFNTLLENEYQYYLEGHDSGWSDWAATTYKTYTNLSPGTYRFRVRARNGVSHPSVEAVYAFSILPPWYMTWWAYSLYALGAVLLAFGARHYYHVLEENRRAQEQARELARERLANERLKQANETLKQANKLKDELLANTSHELRTPLTAILGFTSILREELPEQHHEFLDFITFNGERLLGTVSSLLDLAKIRAGMMEVHPEAADVGEHARRVTQMLAPLAQQKNIALRVDDAEEHLTGYVDPRYLDQIFQNIIGNAIKFTDEGEVVVSTRRERGQVQVVVRDTGIGIDAEFLPHVFEDFKQESSGLDRSHEGSGLGLSIAARFAELMGGDIEVESVKGEGSTFVVSLPVYKASTREWIAA